MTGIASNDTLFVAPCAAMGFEQSYTDQLNRTIYLSELPRRVVSTVPSQTELLASIGMKDEVVGITKFCIHPDDWFRSKRRIGGTKNLNLAAIAALEPDLILANKEENTREQLEWLMERFPVWISDVRSLPDALDMIQQAGRLTGHTFEADLIRTKIKHTFENLTPLTKLVRTAYLIWNDPIMTVNGDTFIHDMLTRSGFYNVFAHRAESRYPKITSEDLRAAGIELLLLSSEPYPFRNNHISRFKSVLPDCTVMLADGEMFSWYGSRLLHFDPSPYYQQLWIR